MLRPTKIALLVLLLPGVGRAAGVPEDLLPAGTQIYLRWDGMDAHREARDRTAWGKFLQGDTGKLLIGLLDDLNNNLGTVLKASPEKLPPKVVRELQANAGEVPKLLQNVARHGVIVGVELGNLNPPQAEFTLLLPKAGEPAAPFLRTMHLLFTLSRQEIQEEKIAGRTVHHCHEGPAHASWWVEGTDGVFTVGLDAPAVVVQRIQKGSGGLAGNPHLQRVQNFKEFETSLRLYVDVAGLRKVVQAGKKEAASFVEALGLDGLKRIAFYDGFDGPAERSLLEISMPGPRKGLLRLSGGKPFKFADLPPLPPDVTSFHASRFDAPKAYDVVIEAVQSVLLLTDPTRIPKMKTALAQANHSLGFDLRQDLLESLGDLFVVYQSPADGPLFFKHVVCLKVQDAPKLRRTLKQALGSLSQRTGVAIDVQKKPYHGVELHEVTVRQPGFVFTPTYAFANDWLVLGYYPQPVQSHILRLQGRLPVWDPDAHVRASLDRLPGEFTSVSMSDPRPGVDLLLAWAPAVASAIKSFAPDAKFDVGALPNAAEMRQLLFPSVTVTTDDGNTYRVQTMASLNVPLALDSLVTDYLLLAVPFAVLRSDRPLKASPSPEAAPPPGARPQPAGGPTSPR